VTAPSVSVAETERTLEIEKKRLYEVRQNLEREINEEKLRQ